MRTDPDPPPPWTNGPLTLYHGTLLGHWMEIARDGVRIDRGRTGTDFGRGFYMTADRDQALQWATRLAAQAGDRWWRSPPPVETCSHRFTASSS